MRTLIALAIGLMMLVSAAAAVGNYNDVCVKIDAESEDNLITGVTVAQVSIAESYIVGNGIDVDQEMDFNIKYNDLVLHNINFEY